MFSDVARTGKSVSEALAQSAHTVAAALAAGVVVIPERMRCMDTSASSSEALEHYGALRADALRAATSTAAAIVAPGSEIGRLEPGYAADLALLDGNPLDAQLPGVLATCVAGRVVWRAVEFERVRA